MDLLIFGDSFGDSFGDVLDNDVLDDDVSDDEIYIPLSVNLSFPAQPRDLDMEKIANFNAIQSSASPKSDINKPQLYPQ